MKKHKHKFWHQTRKNKTKLCVVCGVAKKQSLTS